MNQDLVKQWNDYDKKRGLELHNIILHDDGIPNLAAKCKEIRCNIQEYGYID